MTGASADPDSESETGSEWAKAEASTETESGWAEAEAEPSSTEAEPTPKPKGELGTEPEAEFEQGSDERATVDRQARWQGALVAALAVSLLAVALGLPSLFLLAIVPLGFVLVGQVSASPEPELRLERKLDESRPRPGRAVTVTVSVTNAGDRVVPDLRVADAPPDGVPVTRGSPAFATAVRPGETVSYEYDLVPPRGEYAFGPATVRARSLSGTAVATLEREPAGDARVTCETLLDSLPLHDRTIQFVGRTPTDDGGSGIEFFSTREYRRGDPINRIDWYRYARTGDLATVEYREERAVTIVFVIDDRSGVHRDTPTGGPDSYDLTLYAASRGVVASLEDGNRTGLATLTDDVWVDPGGGRNVRKRVDDAIGDASDPDRRFDSGRNGPSARGRPVADGGAGADFGSGANAVGALVTDLERRLPRRAQVVFCSPLTEDGAVAFVRALRTRGRAVTVVSPDITTGVSPADVPPGARIARLERANRIDDLRGLGAAVVDWDLGDQLSVALARALRVGRRSA
ncbi:DUF58 domain-containing protein [Natrialbaceae archaeon GCM10025810]|uniref:DUF58 domain-containing protein n=1 Tax=Halovalidus salilacus TaxID=3075124 RepID=UPI003614F241